MSIVFFDYFKLIRKIEDEGFSNNIENPNYTLVINEAVTEPLFNYITLNKLSNYNETVKNLIESAKEMIKRNKQPLVYLPCIKDTKQIIDNLHKDYFNLVSKDSFLLFKDKSFLSREIDCPQDIKFSETFDANTYAYAVYDNFNSLVTKYDLYGGLEEEYIPGIINSFNNINGLIKHHYIAKHNDKIVATLTISIDKKTMIGGLANASTLGSYRCKHIGIKLLQYALIDCFDKGMKNVLLIILKIIKNIILNRFKF